MAAAAAAAAGGWYLQRFVHSRTDVGGWGGWDSLQGGTLRGRTPEDCKAVRLGLLGCRTGTPRRPLQKVGSPGNGAGGPRGDSVSHIPGSLQALESCLTTPPLSEVHSLQLHLPVASHKEHSRNNSHCRSEQHGELSLRPTPTAASVPCVHAVCTPAASHGAGLSREVCRHTTTWLPLVTWPSSRGVLGRVDPGP